MHKLNHAAGPAAVAFDMVELLEMDLSKDNRFPSSCLLALINLTASKSLSRRQMYFDVGNVILILSVDFI